MEEDIKILNHELANIRNLIDYYTFESLDYDKKFRMERFEKAIENLIARNEELEEKDKANEAIKKAYREVIDDKGYISKSKIEEEFERMIAHNNCFNVGDMQDLLDRILEGDK